MLRVFVVADTHNKLPQKVVDLAREADEIWHLGDVCEPTITDDLSARSVRRSPLCAAIAIGTPTGRWSSILRETV